MQYLHILFVYDEELKGGIQGYSLCLLANQLKLQCGRSGVNVCAHLLRKNFSRKYSSIPSRPMFISHVFIESSL